MCSMCTHEWNLCLKSVLGLHWASSLSWLHFGDSGVRLQQVPAQEPVDPVRRHRDPGRQRGPPPQQSRVHRTAHATPDREMERAQGRRQRPISPSGVPQQCSNSFTGQHPTIFLLLKYLWVYFWGSLWAQFLHNFSSAFHLLKIYYSSRLLGH